MMQVVLSIQAGLVLPSMLLRKLGSLNRKNRLCLAFRELGGVERTLFLLGYISNSQIRQTIRAETTKIESFNDFLDWITFGGPIIKSGDPVEQEKQLKYATLVANAIMLSNVADLSEVLSSMATDGHPSQLNLLPPPVSACVRTFGASGNTASTWKRCRPRSPQSLCPSNCPCDNFLHVSSGYPTCAATISCWSVADKRFVSESVRPRSAISAISSGRSISMTSRLRPSPSVPILTSRKIQATLSPQVKVRPHNAHLARRPPNLRQSQMAPGDTTVGSRRLCADSSHGLQNVCNIGWRLPLQSPPTSSATFLDLVRQNPRQCSRLTSTG
jgi:hypothetical protein